MKAFIAPSELIKFFQINVQIKSPNNSIIRSLAVDEDVRLRGIGVRLVKTCLDEAKALGVKRVFALSYQPEFFEKLDFKRVDKAVLPHKIWSDCLQCVKFPDCDEEALVFKT